MYDNVVSILIRKPQQDKMLVTMTVPVCFVMMPVWMLIPFCFFVFVAKAINGLITPSWCLDSVRLSSFIVRLVICVRIIPS